MFSFSQEKEASEVSIVTDHPKKSFVSHASMDLSIGPSFGMHPNFRNVYPKGYYFIEGKGSATVLGLPVNLIFRQSDEDLRFGRASYFKASFDREAYHKQHLSSLSTTIGKVNTEITQKQQMLYDLEAKLSYLQQKKIEYQHKLKITAPALPKDSLDLSLNNPFKVNPPDALNLQKPDLNFKKPAISTGIDSLGLNIEALTAAINEAQGKLGKLKQEKEKLDNSYLKAVNKKPSDFLSGIKKIDLGLTTLGKSSISRNAVPIQGVHVQYEGENYFTDVAAGFTLPNQLFSNQAFDQLLYNSGNVFNMGDFFQVNNVRFVSSAKAGWGKESGNHIAIENYYSGKLLKKVPLDASERGLTSNLTTRYSPSKWKNFTWINTIGVTWTTKTDTMALSPVKVEDRIALFSAAIIHFPKLKSNLEASFRKIPAAYDGWVQGIYLTQTERTEVSYKQSLTRRLRTSLRFSRDLFSLQNGLNSVRLINQIGIDIQLKLNSHMAAFGNYSLLQLRERATQTIPRSDLSHLARLGVSSTHEIRKNEFTTLHEVSYARINGFDSTQRLFQASAKYLYQMKRWRFGCQLQVSDYSGLTRLYGQNVILQPEVGFKHKDATFWLSGQQLWSNQFGKDYGMQFKTHFSFSEVVDCDFTMQRFLPTEYALFIAPDLAYKKPLFLKVSLNIHIK